jgi:hypothetical protein
MPEPSNAPTPESEPVLTGICHCGRTGWRFTGDPGNATACNCTICRRYGVLWIYDYVDRRIRLDGPLASYRRADVAKPYLEYLFCPHCACVLAWRGLTQDEHGATRCAVNVRLAEPEAVAALAIDHFDGLDSFEDLPSTGRCVRDYWA